MPSAGDPWMHRGDGTRETHLLHATTVSHAGQALMFVGPSGSGKTGFALEMMGFGARLVADDMTELRLVESALMAQAPGGPTGGPNGQIELREVGIAPAEPHPARLIAAVDLTQTEAERLPAPRRITLLGHSITLFHKPSSPPVAAKFWHYLSNYDGP